MEIKNSVTRQFIYASIASSLLLTYLLAVLNYFPFLSVTLLFIFLIFIFWRWNQNKNIRYFSFLAFASFSALFITIRANPIIVALNFFTAVYLLAITLLAYHKTTLSNPVRYLFSPLTSLILVYNTSVTYPPLFESKFSFNKILKSSLLTFFLLLIIIPLLASANPFFNNLVITILKPISDLSQNMEEFIILNFLRLIFFTFFIIYIPKLVFNIQGKLNQNRYLIPDPTIDYLLIPKIAIIIILGVFTFSQLQLYTADTSTLVQLGYTNSLATREVFSQLIIVAAIVLGVIFFDRIKSPLHSYTTYILIVMTLLLDIFAFYSVYEYSRAWGFTLNRLFGFTGVLWIAGNFILYTYSYIKQQTGEKFLLNAALYTGFIIQLVNIANFDRLIYHNNQSITHAGIDYRYLSTLSSDSLSLKQQYEFAEQFPEITNTNCNSIRCHDVIIDNLENHISYLQSKYNTIDIRTFNLSEYRQFLEIKNLNLEN